MLCYIAGRSVTLPDDEANAAVRRAEAPERVRRGRALLGDDVDLARAGHAADLDTPERRCELAAALGAFEPLAAGLPGVSAALQALLADPGHAWLCLAAAVLADELGSVAGPAAPEA